MPKDMLTKIGSWAFLIGILIALIIGFYEASTIENGENFFATDTGGAVAWVLAIIGVIIGLLAVLGKGTITAKEIPGFLMAGIALVVMGGVFAGSSSFAFIDPWIGSILAGVSMSLSIFVAPAVGILAIKAIWDIGKD